MANYSTTKLHSLSKQFVATMSYTKVKPRPILKHFSSDSSDSSSPSPSPSRGSKARIQVHFPTHPLSLVSTHDAYSSVAYDRSPIPITPNACALPERGCPGRTYGVDDDGSSSEDLDLGDSEIDDYTMSSPGAGWSGGVSAKARVRVRGFNVSRLSELRLLQSRSSSLVRHDSQRWMVCPLRPLTAVMIAVSHILRRQPTVRSDRSSIARPRVRLSSLPKGQLCDPHMFNIVDTPPLKAVAERKT